MSRLELIERIKQRTKELKLLKQKYQRLANMTQVS